VRAAIAVLLLYLPCAALAGLRDVDFDPHTGAPLSTALAFSEGRRVVLGDYLGRAPVVLVLGYLGCVNLCSTTLRGVNEALQLTGLRAGEDYTALFVSIDPRDETSPPEQRPGWHFLTGAKSAAVVARRVGFRYAYEPESGQFAHPAGFVVLDPLGEVSAYFTGVRFDPAELRAALLSAKRGEKPGILERVMLVCFHDPVSGRYNDAVISALRLAIFGFFAAIGWLVWRRR
jgi:protein SCO1/2